MTADASANGLPVAPRLPLCASEALAERSRGWVWDVLHFGQPARAFALRIEGRVVAYLNRCVHVPTELDWQPGEFLDTDKRFILCSLHGAAYDPAHGQCVGGPCGRGRLTVIRVEEDSTGVHWYPSRDTQPTPNRTPDEPPR
mgnify:CR=1 FL=1